MPSSLTTCAHCCLPKAKSGAPCLLCGSIDQSVSIELAGQEVRSTLGNLGIVSGIREASVNKYRLQVQTPVGARSDANLADGAVSLAICGPLEIGRKGERRAFDTFLDRLRQDGRCATIEPGRDQLGEDGILVLQLLVAGFAGWMPSITC